MDAAVEINSIHRLFDWLIDRSIHLLIDCSSDWLIDCSSDFFSTAQQSHLILPRPHGASQRKYPRRIRFGHIRANDTGKMRPLLRPAKLPLRQLHRRLRDLPLWTLHGPTAHPDQWPVHGGRTQNLHRRDWLGGRGNKRHHHCKHYRWHCGEQLQGFFNFFPLGLVAVVLQSVLELKARELLGAHQFAPKISPFPGVTKFQKLTAGEEYEITIKVWHWSRFGFVTVIWVSATYTRSIMLC